MNPERWQQIKTLFDKAVDLEPAARKAYLEEAAGGDVDLLAEAQKLLEQNDAAGDFLEKPVTDRISKVAIFTGGTLTSGTTLGPFRILREIGAGGMGTIYLAEQRHPVVRQVALKMIRPGIVDKSVLSRFDSERQALAMMNHPHIAQIYHADAAPDGRPYFAMEYVPGQWLTEYCDERRLPLAERIRLFLQACSAIAHAHEKGIIHRDIKPSNVLVTETQGEPMVKIIDFGIVKTKDPLTEDMVRTKSKIILGTLTYVSPEQAGVTENRVGAYSDVYSLGILLYELITGVSPFEVTPKTPFHVTMSLIRNMVPPLPSMWFNASEGKCIEVAHNRGTEPHTLAGQIWGDLDGIIMKAVEKDPARRYASADELRLDLQQYLAAKPVSVVHPTRAPGAADPESATATMAPNRSRTLLIAALLLSLAAVLAVTFAWLDARGRARDWQHLLDLQQLAAEVTIRMEEARASEHGDISRQVRQFARERINRIEAELADMTGTRQQAGWAILGRILLATGDDRGLPQKLKQAGVTAASGALSYLLGICYHQQQMRAHVEAILTDGAFEERDRLRSLSSAHLDDALAAGAGDASFIESTSALHDGFLEMALSKVETMQTHGREHWHPGSRYLLGDIQLIRACQFWRQGQIKEAEETWTRAQDAYAGVIDAYPSAPDAYVRTAWLALMAIKWQMKPRAEMEAQASLAIDRARACDPDHPGLAMVANDLMRL